MIAAESNLQHTYLYNTATSCKILHETEQKVELKYCNCIISHCKTFLTGWQYAFKNNGHLIHFFNSLKNEQLGYCLFEMDTYVPNKTSELGPLRREAYNVGCTFSRSLEFVSAIHLTLNSSLVGSSLALCFRLAVVCVVIMCS